MSVELPNGMNTNPAQGGYAITPSDSANLPTLTRALLVGTSGDVKVSYPNDSTDVLPLVAGIMYPIVAKRVWSTGTTAANIHGLY
jgi:hypothetical protein